MRKITKQMAEAFTNFEPFNKDNTRVFIDRNFGNPMAEIYLHGNLIARRFLNSGKVFVTNAGWKSNVTKERLNAIEGVRIYQKNFNWYLNGNQWEGDLVEVQG